MDFKKYSSIENSYRQSVIDEIFARGMDREEWVVTEKVHGSNFSFWMDNVGLRCAKRSGFLTPHENFFGWKTVVEAYDIHLSVLYQVCCSMIHDLVREEVIELTDDNIEVVLYGELFGGMYNHPEVEPYPNASKVQKGVSYCPWNDFYAFDLKINGAFLAYDLFEEIISATGFHYAKSLFRGPFNQCLKYPNDLPTQLPKKMGLPEIEGNISEGVVLKPAKPLFFPNGSRVLLKNKNEKFREKKHKKKAPKPEVVLTDEEMEVINLANDLTNDNRLRNVLSKIGEVNDKMFGKVLGMLCQDIMEDLHKEAEDVFNGWEKDRVKLVNKAISKNTQVFLRERFLDVIDGTL
jgi:Rnl2 family RNA ligase